jgi:GH15 family glucan-1,4-alpha-glucosidase
VERRGDGLRATRTLRAGQTGGLVLESMGGPPRRIPPEELQHLAADTAAFWRGWLHRSAYTGRWREMVARSAMTLKLMTYAPTGAIVAAPTTGLPEQGWLDVARMIDWLCDHWDQPDEGIWETAAAAGTSPTAGSRPGWRSTARSGWLSTGPARPTWCGGPPSATASTPRSWNAAGTRSSVPSPSTTAPRCSDSLVYRYNPAASPDGLAGDEGTFSLCTFWYVDALARAGRLDDARLTFEKMHTYANHLGLYSEEIGSTGEQLGNFPQAFSHLALISAAINLDYQLDHGADSLGRADQPWPG